MPLLFLQTFYCHSKTSGKSLPSSTDKRFSCSVTFVVGLVLEAMLQIHDHYLEIFIRNNSADNALPCGTWFRNLLEKTRFSRVSIMNFKHTLTVVYQDDV